MPGNGRTGDLDEKQTVKSTQAIRTALGRSDELDLRLRCQGVKCRVATLQNGRHPMGPQDLDSELKKEPFQPFRIVTTTGKN
jgi:hypothetical protein